jgi:hypothetical protein
MGKSGEDLGVVAGLVRASFLVNAGYAESAREYGLTVQQGQLLCVLMGRPYGMGDLGATLGLEKSSLTGLVDRAVRVGLAALLGTIVRENEAPTVFLDALQP